MFLVVRKDDPLIYKGFNRYDAGTIAFDPEIYEEIEVDDLPEGAVQEPEPKSVGELMSMVFEAMPAIVRAVFAPHEVAITSRLAKKDYEAVALIIQTAVLPSSLTPEQTELAEAGRQHLLSLMAGG